LISVPELGFIPSAKKADFGESKSLSVLNGSSPYGNQLELIANRDASSPITDSYRAVVASLLFAEGHGSGGRSIAVSSSMPAEGKTTAVCNLAVVLTRIDRRVLVIDGDFRRPRLSAIFGMSETRGLADLLRSEEPLSTSSLINAARPTSIPGISVLPVGSHSASDIDLLHSSRLPEILRLAKGAYDYVLVDTPPVLPVADARIMAKHVDGVVLICRASVTRSDQLRTAAQRLQGDGTRVIGTILNDFGGAENYYRTSSYHQS
jgi:capsular exopolysaccharide synthesis family protein